MRFALIFIGWMFIFNEYPDTFIKFTFLLAVITGIIAGIQDVKELTK